MAKWFYISWDLPENYDSRSWCCTRSNTSPIGQYRRIHRTANEKYLKRILKSILCRINMEIATLSSYTTFFNFVAEIPLAACIFLGLCLAGEWVGTEPGQKEEKNKYIYGVFRLVFGLNGMLEASRRLFWCGSNSRPAFQLVGPAGPLGNWNVSHTQAGK